MKVNGIIGTFGEWCCLKFLYTLSFECLTKVGGVVKLIDFGLAKKLPDGEETLRSAFASFHLFLSNSINILVKHSFSYPKVSQHSAGYFEICLPWKFSEIWPRWWAAGLTILRRIRVNSKVNFSTRNWMKKLKLTLNWDVQVHSIMI